MVIRALLVVAVLATAASSAHAEGEIDRVTKLGFRIGYGAIPIDTTEARSTTIGLGVEHPVFGRTRVFGEWEWMWLNDWKEPENETMSLHGSGQRVTLGLRHALGVMPIDSKIRIFIDGELGGGAMLASEDRMGVLAVPVGLAGVRMGYDFRNGNSSSRVFEAELMLRAIIVPTGYGMMFGVGMLWGD